MTQQPTLSIIINNHNYGRYLAEAIESALAQRYPFTEVVVVDDGSTDDSREIIARYADRIRPVLKPNGGQGSAFNAGFKACTGDIIIFLDSDDCLMPDAAERVVSVWRPGLSKVHFRLRDMRQDGTFLPTCTPRLGRPLQSGDLAPTMAAHGYYQSPPTSGNAYSREALEALLPLDEPDWRIAADMPLNHLCPFVGEFEAIQEPLGCYRKHGRNWSRAQFKQEAAQLAWIARHRLIDGLVAEAAKARGLWARPERSPHYRIMLLWLRVVAPGRFPPPRPSTWRLAASLVLTGWRLMPNWKKSVAFSVAIALVPLLPSPWARRYVNQMFKR